MKQLILIFLIFVSFLLAGENDSHRIVKNFLVDAMAEKYDIEQSDVEMKLYHLPELDFRNRKLQIVNRSRDLEVGYNRLKLQILKDGRVQNEIRITYTVKIEILTPVLTRDVKFGRIITAADLSLEKRSVSNNYDKYLRDTKIPDNMIAKTILRKGDILMKTDLRTKPVIDRGQDVALKVKSGNILIEMNGIAKEEGSQGEKIRVYNRETRKHYFGIVESPQTVVINIE
ncbi:MAG: flagellar basal body P-ring formation chaperone FlgA [Bacteroidota bacterium]